MYCFRGRGRSFSNPVLAHRQTNPPGKTDDLCCSKRRKSIEPIDGRQGGLDAPTGGDATAAELKLFNSTYHKKGAAYKLIFGGAANGTVTVNSSDPASDCAKNLATVGVTSTKAKLAGKVMALATNAPGAKKAPGVRRLPTPAERVIADNLVKAEFAKQGNSAAIIETRDYHNLTALDVDGDGKIELVGSFWVKPDDKTRIRYFSSPIKVRTGISNGFWEVQFDQRRQRMKARSQLDTGVYHELC